jgi:signal transduction histidine kinase
MLDVDPLALLDRLAHDLRQPVHNVLALCEVMTSGMYGQVSLELREPLADLAAEGARMQALVEDTLDLVRIAAGRARPEPVRCDLAGLLERVCGRCGAEWVGTTPTSVYVDEPKLERALDRLIGAATRTGEKVRVTTEPELPLRVRIEPAPEVSFDPMAPSTTLGAAVARELLLLLGGDVRREAGAFLLEVPGG